MTKSEIINSLKDQARDKEVLANGDADSIFAHDAQTLLEAAELLERSNAQRISVNLDRNQWGRCYICKDAIYLDGDICVSGTYHIRPDFFEYCPNCGRPLTEEAWAELERKITDG